MFKQLQSGTYGFASSGKEKVPQKNLSNSFLLKEYGVVQLRSSTFYGVYHKSFGGTPRQGPHTVAHAAINASLGSLSGDELWDYFNNHVSTPNSIRQILRTGKEDIYDSDAYGYDSESSSNPALDDYLDKYTSDYDCAQDAFQNWAREDPSDLDNIGDSYIEEARLYVEILINANPYATYGWNLNGGATEAMLSGKAERAVNFFNFTTAAEVLQSNCLDTMFMDDKIATFQDVNGIREYLQNLFIHLPPAEIDLLVPALPDPL